MATEFYLFSAFVAQGGTDADLPSLELEVLAVGGGLATKFEYSEKTPAGAPTGVTFTFTVALTAGEKTSLDGVVAAHLGTPTVAPDPIIQNTAPVDGQLIVYDSSASPQAGYVNRTVSGDVTIDVAGSVTIASDAVTYDKIQDVVANNVFLGNDDGAGSTVQELTGTEATVLLDVFTAALKGLAPASGGGTTNFLRADGTWAAPAGTTDELVKITVTDTTAGFLDAKLIPGAGLTRTILNPAADEDYQMDVVANADGSIVVNANDIQVGVLATDAQHGTRGGGTLHAVAVAGVSAGFISAADQTKVDNLSGTNTGDVTLAGALNYITIAGQVITRNAIDLTTDVTGQLPTANIADDAVTYAKIQNVAANNVLLGNDSGAGSIVQELTGAEVNLFLPVFTAALNGLVPLSGGGTTNFLRADGTWAAPVGATDELVKITASDTTAGFLDAKLIPGAGLTRTILNPAADEDYEMNVVANADGSIVVNANDVQVGVLATDAQHGTRGGGTLHATAVAGVSAGFISAADQTKVDNLSGTNTGDVTLAGTPNYITIAGQVITRNLINLGTHVTGTLPTANIADNAVTNIKLADMAANTVKVRNQATTGDPVDLAIGTNTVLGRVAGNIVAAQVVAAQIATNAVTTVKILDANVTNAKLANMAQSTFKGRAAGTGTGVPIDLSATQATAILDVFTSALKGLAPASGGGTTNFLRADGTWAAPTAGSGDVTGPASSADNQVVRFDGATGKVIQGRTAGIFTYDDVGVVTLEVAAAGHALFITNTTASGEFIRMVNSTGNGAIEFNAGGQAGIVRVLGGTASEIPRFLVDANTGVLVDFSAAGVALPTDFIFTVQGAATGDGVQIMAGEADGDIALHIADQDNSLIILEVHADIGQFTFGKTYAQTIIDNGIAYGIDNQFTAVAGREDFNTQVGQYRMAGTPIPLKTYDFYADQVEFPTGTNWNVNVGAPASADSNNAALTVRLFDDTVDEAIGFIVNVPEQAVEMVVTTIARRESGVALQDAIMVLHSRSIGDAAAVGAWTTDALTTVALPANENFVYDVTDQTLATWGLTAGTIYQMQLSRDANAGGDTLVGDLALLAVRIEFR